jgi:phage shock protein B
VGEFIGLVAVLAPFVFVLALIWMVMHYRQSSRLSEAEKSAPPVELLRRAEAMEHRIEALERILDAESPGWRHRHDRI